MCAPAKVVEDIKGGILEVGDGAGGFEDVVMGPRAHVHAFHGVAKFLQIVTQCRLAIGLAGIRWLG